jgi:hypothetical protein
VYCSDVKLTPRVIFYAIIQLSVLLLCWLWAVPWIGHSGWAWEFRHKLKGSFLLAPSSQWATLWLVGREVEGTASSYIGLVKDWIILSSSTALLYLRQQGQGEAQGDHLSTGVWSCMKGRVIEGLESTFIWEREEKGITYTQRCMGWGSCFFWGVNRAGRAKGMLSAEPLSSLYSESRLFLGLFFCSKKCNGNSHQVFLCHWPNQLLDSMFSSG